MIRGGYQMNKDDLMIMRRVTWCKTKGELLSILEYYMGSRDGEQEQKNFETMYEKIHEFVKWMDEESPIA
jgi:hypothetical protein